MKTLINSTVTNSMSRTVDSLGDMVNDSVVFGAACVEGAAVAGSAAIRMGTFTAALVVATGTAVKDHVPATVEDTFSAIDSLLDRLEQGTDDSDTNSDVPAEEHTVDTKAVA
jgi:hypothetical protein